MLKDSLENVRKMNSSLVDSSSNYTSWETIDGCTVSNIKFEENISEPVKPWKKGMTSDGNENNNLPVNATFSSNIPSSVRDKDKEATGLPPNFVHSIDASHMRLFVDKMSEITNNFWSVHDAFGVHPNFGDELLKIGTKTFFEAHNCDGRGSLLHKLVHESLDLFDKKIEQTTVPSDESKSTKKTSGKADKLEEIYTKLTEITNSTDKDLVNAGDKVGMMY